MSSEAISTVQATPQSAEFTFEYSTMIVTGDKRWSKTCASVPRVKELTQMFASVELISLEVEVTQMTLLGTVKTTLHNGGVCFVGLIPTGQDTEALSGTNGATIFSVPRKTAFPLSSQEQVTRLHVMDLTGYENDLAQDPRRKQGPVMWFGNTGVGTYAETEARPIAALTWRGKLRCAGTSTLW